MDNLGERHAPALTRGGLEHFAIERIPKRESHPQMPFGGEPQDFPGLFSFIERGRAGAHAQFPGRQLHERGGLTGVKQPLEFFRRIGGQDGDNQRRPGEMSGPFSASGEGFLNFLILDGDKLPGLTVFRGLRAPSGVQDGERHLFRQGFVLKFAHSALGADGFGNVHGKTP
jgi:hypothetical protein